MYEERPPRTAWRRSSYSGGNDNCVEVAHVGDVFAVRDSKDPDGARLRVGSRAWRAFVAGVRGGTFER
ncbi:MAG: DUF397 domain-containing protein [Nocardioidaceae bacterium]